MSGHGNDDLAEIQSDSGVSVGSGGVRALHQLQLRPKQDER